MTRKVAGEGVEEGADELGGYNDRDEEESACV